MKSRNPYEYLRTDCLSDMEPVKAQSVWTLTNSRSESVSILTSVLENGAWVFGYMVNWHNGRNSSQDPDPALGKFRTQREAKLYGVGFMLGFLEYFIEDTRVALKDAEASLLQAELF